MTMQDDGALETALAKALGPDAEDTAPLSRAVLTQMATTTAPHRPHLAEVLAMPGPAAGLMLGALLLAGALGYALLPGDAVEVLMLQVLIGAGG
jgi:hypothetical protein